jgi:hypothetical protein
MLRQPSALLAGVVSRDEAFERAEMLLLVPAQDTGVRAIAVTSEDPYEKPAAGHTPCPAVGMVRTARVTLAHPLGTRGDPGRRVRPTAGQRVPDTLTGRAAGTVRARAGTGR